MPHHDAWGPGLLERVQWVRAHLEYGVHSSHSINTDTKNLEGVLKQITGTIKRLEGIVYKGRIKAKGDGHGNG